MINKIRKPKKKFIKKSDNIYEFGEKDSYNTGHNKMQSYHNQVMSRIRQLVIEDVPHKFQARLLEELKEIH